MSQTPSIKKNYINLEKIIDDNINKVVDIDNLLMCLTFDIIGNVCMSETFDTLLVNQYGLDMKDLFHNVIDELVTYGRAPVPYKWWLSLGLDSKYNKHLQQREFLRKAIFDLVQRSR